MSGSNTYQDESRSLVDFFRRPTIAPGGPTPAPPPDALGAVLARLDAVEERLRHAEARLAELDGG